MKRADEATALKEVTFDRQEQSTNKKARYHRVVSAVKKTTDSTMKDSGMSGG